METKTEPKYLLIVTARDGLVVRNTPRPEGKGGVKLRAESVGAQLYAFRIINVDGVQYAALVPRNPFQPEWVRVAEAGGVPAYVDVIELAPSNSDRLVDAIERLTAAILSKG